ncbi:hypothetical protein D9M73_281270 [compost metagenome]
MLAQKALFQRRIDLTAGLPVSSLVGIGDLGRQHRRSEMLQTNVGFEQPGRQCNDHRVEIFTQGGC